MLGFSVVLEEVPKKENELFAYLCLLMVTFANSLDPYQARQNVWSDLDPNTDFFFSKKLILKQQQATKKACGQR